MDIFDRNPVKCLEDVVFTDYMTRQKVLAKSTKRAATNTLFSGPAGRAVRVLANEGIKLPAVNAEKLIEIKANCESGRQIMRALDEFAMSLTMANTPNTQSKI